MGLSAVGRSELGLVRPGNEDSAVISPAVFAVADGLGGHIAGEIASSLTIKRLTQLAPKTRINQEKIESLIAEIDENIAEHIESNPEHEGMGTTLTAIFPAGKQLVLAHVGDSRAYRFTSNQLTRLTNDHTMVQLERSLLTQALMGKRNVRADISTLKPKTGDRFLLCTDGLTNVVSEPDIEHAMSHQELSQVINSLISLAHSAGAPDNVSAIVIEVGDEESSETLYFGSAVGT